MLTQARLLEILQYNPDTGIFTWIKSPRKGWIGKEAATNTSKRYLEIRIDGILYKAHRCAWLYIHGFMPKNEIDHIDQNTHNNRIDNLREATRFDNTHNTRTPTTNTSGIKGVYWLKKNKKWVGQVAHNGVQHYLGLFSEIEQAEQAVRLKRLELHKEFANHG